jgi:hypothetical protein
MNSEFSILFPRRELHSVIHLCEHQRLVIFCAVSQGTGWMRTCTLPDYFGEFLSLFLQAISAQPAAAGLGGHDDDGSQNALQRQIDKAKSIDDLGTMISAMDPLEANNEVLKGKEGSVDWASPIRSLDQLFAQAAGLDIILKAMVQRWAFSSDGSFALKGNKVRSPRQSQAAGVLDFIDAITTEHGRRIIDAVVV